jgi:hypothetical protein
MTWENFYLVCFIVGFALAVIGFLSGTLHWPFAHSHAPGFHMHGMHLPHGPVHGVPAHGAGAAHGAPAHGADVGSSISPYNFATFMAFLAWFGGMGYLLTARGNLSRLIVLSMAVASGVVGSAIVFTFLTKVLLKHERALDSADFEMIGVLGRVTVPMRPGGTGEIVYSQAGTRRSTGARSESGGPIVRGSEVIVTRYERGIAYVRPWEELAGMEVSQSNSATKESTNESPTNNN